MTGKFERHSRPHFDNRHPYHQQAIIDHPQDQHRQMTPKVKSRLHDYGQKERQNQNALNAPIIDCPGLSFLPLIPSSTKPLSTPPINTTSEKYFLLRFEEIEQPSTQKFESRNPVKKANQETDKMAPKQTRAAAAKTKELESVETPLVRILRNSNNAKV